MSWRDRLRKASFRGVDFFVDTAEAEFGRRTVKHEYPLRDKPYVEDLGRKAREITVEAYVLATAANGLDYMPARDALIAALEQAGPGTLVHPFIGELRVSLTESKLRESTREGGIARFTLTFVEAGEVIFPAAQASTAAVVSTRADTAKEAVKNGFLSKFKVASLPSFISKDSLAKLQEVTLDVIGLPRSVANGTGLSDFMQDGKALFDNLDNLVTSPTQLASSLFNQIEALRSLANRPGDSLKLLKKLYGDNDPPPSDPPPTPQQGQNSQNLAAISDLVQGAAAVASARGAAETAFDSADDATAARDDIAEQLDELMERTTSDDVYAALADLRAACVSDLTARGASRPRLVTITPPATLPALALAYGIYGDAERDEEIVTRNNVRHPGFVPGGQPLEVLADA